MAGNIALYPTLTNELQNQLRFQPSPYQMQYDYQGQKRLLKEELASASGKETVLKDDYGLWEAQNFNLIINREIILKNTKCLFGPKGIACQSASIGVGLLWYSPDSRQRGSHRTGNITAEDSSVRLSLLKGDFQEGQLRGTLELAIVLYINKPGIPEKDETHLANVPGYLLGELDSMIYRLDGQGSVFPIYEIEKPGAPLWYVSFEWSDPLRDQFSETFFLFLNKKHSGYQYIDINQSVNKYYVEDLMNEIIASAVGQVILKVKENESDWNDILSGSFEPGSVAEAISYFLTTHDIDVNSAENLSLSLRKIF